MSPSTPDRRRIPAAHRLPRTPGIGTFGGPRPLHTRPQERHDRIPAAVLCLALLPVALAAQQPPPPATPGTSISARTAGTLHRDGFIPLNLNEATGAISLELPKGGLRGLMYGTLATGLGSNPIGLDRGANGAAYVVRFERAGNVVQVIFENWTYRSSGDSLHLRTVLEAFPPTTSAALPILAEEGDRLLVDATEFVLRDWNDVSGTLQRTGEGTYTVAKDRSRVYAPFTKAFPTNSEIDVALTFATTGTPGRTVESIVPDGRAFTLRQHLSFLPLPDASYRPRAYDPHRREREGIDGSSTESASTEDRVRREADESRERRGKSACPPSR